MSIMKEARAKEGLETPELGITDKLARIDPATLEAFKDECAHNGWGFEPEAVHFFKGKVVVHLANDRFLSREVA